MNHPTISGRGNEWMAKANKQNHDWRYNCGLHLWVPTASALFYPLVLLFLHSAFHFIRTARIAPYILHFSLFGFHRSCVDDQCYNSNFYSSWILSILPLNIAACLFPSLLHFYKCTCTSNEEVNHFGNPLQCDWN